MADTCALFQYDPSFGDWDPTCGPDPVPCAEEAACTITFGCMGEHIDTARTCYACALDVQMCAWLLACRRCEQKCEVQIKWDDPEVPVTIVQEVSRG